MVHIFLERTIMHMADALVSPAVGSIMWAASASLIVYSSKKVHEVGTDSKTALMGVLGAFVFAAQMINFTIPATGSSGHLGGGLILSILLGPYAAFIVMASILTVQALIFGDGGILALGCNIFNLGFWTCFIAYPLVYKKIAGNGSSRKAVITGSILAAVFGLQLGAFSVVLETTFSGISDLPFSKFALLMQPIHLAIGIVEGVVTALVVLFVYQARPELITVTESGVRSGRLSMRAILIVFLFTAVSVGGILAWFASSSPDGLEWAMSRISGQGELESHQDKVHKFLSSLQEKTSMLPDYGFKAAATSESGGNASSWPGINIGTSLSGIVGSILTLAAVFLLGVLLKRNGNHGKT
jgi:cobalt/nickel transport system permease protein